VGKAIVVGLTLIALVLILGTFYLTRAAMRKDGDLNIDQEKQLKSLVDKAERIFYGLVNPMSLDNANLLTIEYTKAINKWLDEYKAQERNT